MMSVYTVWAYLRIGTLLLSSIMLGRYELIKQAELEAIVSPLSNSCAEFNSMIFGPYGAVLRNGK
jgi:hypothetical protein